MRSLLPAGVAMLAAAGPLQLLRALLEYRLRTPDIQVINLIYQLLNSLGILWIAHISPRVEHLLLGTVCATAVAFALHLRAVLLNGGFPAWRLPRWRLGRVLLSRSRGHFGLQAVNAVALPANRYVLVSYDLAGTYAAFDVMVRVALGALGILQSVNIQVYGMALRARSIGQAHVNRLVTQTTTVSAVLWSLGILTLLRIGDSVYSFILPGDAAGTALLLTILVAGVAASGVAEPSTRALWALGKENATAAIRVAALVVNLLLAAILSWRFPLLTAVTVAYSISIAFGSLLTLRSFTAASKL